MYSRLNLRFALSIRGRFAVTALLAWLSAITAALAADADVGDYLERLRYPSDNKWVSYGQGDTQAGNRSVNSGGELMAPLWQNSNSLLFSDFRTRANDHGGVEGNFGLAYRQITASNWILGASAYYDLRRSNFGNTFQQATVGVEAMSINWDARANAYIPDGRAYTVQSGLGVGPATPVLIGNQLALNYSGALIERSYYGFDGELGYLLASSSSGNAEIRGFAGGYDFQTQDSRFPSIVGFRSRVEGRLYDLSWLMGDGSRLVAGFEYQYDAVRQSQYIGLLQVRIPLQRSRWKLSRLERRMLDTVVRDVDVVAQAATVQTNTVTSEAVQIQSPIDGRWDPIGNITQANASNDLSQIVQNAGAGSTVFVDGSNGPLLVSNPVVMNDSQRMFGGGETVLIRGATTHEEVNYTIPGMHPTVIGTNVTNDVVVVNNNTWVQGFSIIGGYTGVSSGETMSSPGYQSIDRVAIRNIDVSDSFAGVGVGDTSNSLIQNVYASNNLVGFVTGNLTNTAIKDNLAVGNVFGFFTVGLVDQGSVFQNNVAAYNTDDGYHFEGGIGTTGQFNNNLAYNNGGYGLYANTVDGRVFNNVVDSNGLDGMYLFDVTSNGVVDQNLFSNNGHNGFYGYFMDGQFTNNTASWNNWSGIGVIDSVSGLIANNVACNNGGHGFYLNSLTSTAVVINNKANYNTNGFAGVGFNGYTDNAGLIMNNTASNNLDYGFEFSQALTGTMSSNSAVNNRADGFNLGNGIGSGGLFTGNSSVSNGGYGYNIFSNAGTASGNTGSGNGNGNDTYP